MAEKTIGVDRFGACGIDVEPQFEVGEHVQYGACMPPLAFGRSVRVRFGRSPGQFAPSCAWKLRHAAQEARWWHGGVAAPALAHP